MENESLELSEDDDIQTCSELKEDDTSSIEMT